MSFFGGNERYKKLLYIFYYIFFLRHHFRKISIEFFLKIFVSHTFYFPTFTFARYDFNFNLIAFLKKHETRCWSCILDALKVLGYQFSTNAACRYLPYLTIIVIPYCLDALCININCPVPTFYTTYPLNQMDRSRHRTRVEVCMYLVSTNIPVCRQLCATIIVISVQALLIIIYVLLFINIICFKIGHPSFRYLPT